MKATLLMKTKNVMFILTFFLFSRSNSQSLPSRLNHEYAEVNGITLHYVKEGNGEALVLLHGFGQNWSMWNRLLPELSEKFTVIVPDLRGVGESDKPETGYDKKTMAEDIHQLVVKNGFTNVYVVGHDIGMMVAYAYAKSYPNEISRLILMDAIVPGVEPEWTESSRPKWWFSFFKWPSADEIITGKEELFLESFYDPGTFQKHSFTTEEEIEFIKAYSQKGALNGSFSWFRSFDQDVKDNSNASLPSTIKVLAIGGDHSNAKLMTSQLKTIAPTAEMITLKDCGHWLVQEQTDKVKDIFRKFLIK